MSQELTPELTEWLSIRDEHIRQLQEDLLVATKALQTAQRNVREVNEVKQTHIAYVNAYEQKTSELEREVHQWQHDYEQLRIQKGGFGFKMLLASGLLATLVGMAAGWLLFRQRDSNAVLFESFNKAAGFNVEYNLSHQQYDQARKIIREFQSNSVYQPILPELALIDNMIQAVQLHGDSTLQSVGYSVIQHDSISSEQPRPVRSLVVVHDGIVQVRAEALPDAVVLTTLKKKDKVDQWDKTTEVSKLRIADTKGKKGVAEDYWYEVETADGVKGWVFGYFTNASIHRFKPDVPDSLLVVPAAPKKDSLK